MVEIRRSSKKPVRSPAQARSPSCAPAHDAPGGAPSRRGREGHHQGVSYTPSSEHAQIAARSWNQAESLLALGHVARSLTVRPASSLAPSWTKTWSKRATLARFVQG